jgi:hypothetical protein
MKNCYFSRIAFLFYALLGALNPSAFGQDERASTTGDITVRSEKGVSRWRNSTGISNFNIEVRGKIEVTDDDKDIKSISNDGYLEITKTVFGSKRTIVIESQGSGRISRQYYEGRNKMEWDPHGKNWLGEILPEIVRSTTLAAEGRVDRIYAKSGSSGVLDELDELKSDYTRAHYAKLLLAKNIPSSELPRVITTIAELIGSDYYLSNVLQNNIDKFFSSQAAADAFFLASRKIGSDYYKSVVLKSALKKFPASTAQVKVILKSASEIGSDYYQSVVLTTLLEENDVQDESLLDLVNTCENISSDYYQTQVLRKVIDRRNISKNTLNAVVEALGDVSSDYYKSTVFSGMAEHCKMESDTQLRALNVVGSTVNSDYYAASVLKNFVQHQDLGDASFTALVKVAGNLNSSTYASDVLRTAAKGELSQSQLFGIIAAAEGIKSDYYLSEVLISLSPQVRSAGGDVKEAYRKAAKNINSDTYYGKTVKAID